MTIFIMTSRFFCEILALIIFGLWGFQQGEIIGAIGVPIVVAVIWAMWGSPKAPYKLHGFYGFAFELLLFLMASYTLYSLGHTYIALTYCIVVIGISFLIHFMDI
jgi:hypothetical protein